MRFVVFVLSLFLILTAHARDIKDLRSFGDISLNTIYLFAAPNCPHCRTFHRTIFPELLKRYVKTKRAQILIVDMAYDEPSIQAAMLMRCLPEEKSQKMMNWLYENQSRWINSKDTKNFFLQYALLQGMTMNEFNQCLNDETLRDELLSQRDNLSNLYRVSGWPTMVLRQGNSVKHYVGIDRRAILYSIEADITSFEQKQNPQKK